MGMHRAKAEPAGLGRTLSELLHHCNVTTLIYQPRQPLQTLRRHVVIVPRKAEQEAGFQSWLRRVRDLGRNTGAKLAFYAPGGDHALPAGGRRTAGGGSAVHPL